MLKIKTDSNNQIDIENKSIEVSDRVSADGAVTISAKTPTEIKIIKATAAKALITDKGEIPISALDAASVKRTYNIIRSPIMANIEANKKDSSSDLPNGKYGVMFHIYGSMLNFPGAFGANEEDNHIVITLNLDSGVKFYKDVVPFLKKTKEWKSMEALYGKYFYFDELIDKAGEINHSFNVSVTPHPTEEAPKTQTTTSAVFEEIRNGETDFELNLDNNDYVFEFQFELKDGCSVVDVDWENYVVDPNSEVGNDDALPNTEYQMYAEANETIGAIANRFKAMHPELDFETRSLYAIRNDIKMPPLKKVDDEVSNTPVEHYDVMFLIENTISFKYIDMQNIGNNKTYSITVPAGSQSINDIYEIAVGQFPEISVAADAVVKEACVYFNIVYQPVSIDDGSRISWNDSSTRNFTINTDRYPGEYLEMYIDRSLTPEA